MISLINKSIVFYGDKIEDRLNMEFNNAKKEEAARGSTTATTETTYKKMTTTMPQPEKTC